MQRACSLEHDRGEAVRNIFSSSLSSSLTSKINMGTKLVLFLAALVLISNLFSSCQAYSCQMDPSSIYHYPNPSHPSNHSSSSPPPAESYHSIFNHHQQHKKDSIDPPAYATDPESASPASATGLAAPPPAPQPHPPHPPPDPSPVSIDILNICQNLAYVTAEFTMVSATGEGVDSVDSTLAGNGPAPQGARKAFLDYATQDLVKQIALQNIDHYRVVRTSLGAQHAIDRPAMDLHSSVFADVVNRAFGKTMWPYFDPYVSTINSLLGCYWFHGLLTKCYVGAMEKMEGPVTKRLAASLAAAKASQEAVIRTLLYQKLRSEVHPYRTTVGDFTNKLSQYRDKVIGASGVSDEGLWVPSCLGTGGSNGNIFSTDGNSLPYGLANQTSIISFLHPFLPKGLNTGGKNSTSSH